jgi:SAM-dependent methyltransferase
MLPIDHNANFTIGLAFGGSVNRTPDGGSWGAFEAESASVDSAGDKKVTPRDSDQEWEEIGRTDPYYGVITHEKFRQNRLNDDSLREFFTSGQDHIDFVLETIRTSVDSRFFPSSALDFGCGVGRCSIPLTRVCQSVVGVDASDGMLQEAREICSAHSISNLRLVKSDDTLSRVSGPFDLVHSFLVFQHIPRKRGEQIFTR